MDLPLEIRLIIEELANGQKITDLRRISNALSDKYLNESGQGKNLVVSDLEALTYAIVRMPATYSSVYSSLKYTFEFFKEPIDSVLDIGAGVGTASIVVSQFYKGIKYNCVEREKSMINLGKKLTSDLNVEWIESDFTKSFIDKKADLMIASYSLNELSPTDRNRIVSNLWSLTNKLLVIVEPGTVVASNALKTIRNDLVKEGGYIVAPCPYCEECKMGKDDWCHFSSRIARSRLHKLVKDVDVPFEDEKFSYLAISKTKVDVPCGMRILRHPVIKKGYTEITVCGSNGIETLKITKKDDCYKQVKKSKVGDLII